MPYPAGHRAEVKRKIVESARKLFNRHGFDGVSLHQIMSGAGLTHGGFYSYFRTKSDLYAEVLGCFFTDPNWKNCWEGVEVDLTSSGAGEQVIRAYLSDQHLENVENSCPMVALPSDVARSGPRAKRAFQTVFQAMVDVLNRSLPDARRTPRPAASQATAQAIAALCVGGMVVARAISDRSQADSLRDACMSIALNLGGWRHQAKSKNGKPKANAAITQKISYRRAKAISATAAS
ncbi:MAG TPA: TetR/AcrR family transcriptional regulator [Candidatus Acidoferrum sp.]|nr:TetR/AcrR family transcriptional regulator [Candidatus Acidoferrum sp.]